MPGRSTDTKVFWRNVPLVELWPRLVVLASIAAVFLGAGARRGGWHAAGRWGRRASLHRTDLFDEAVSVAAGRLLDWIGEQARREAPPR